MSDQVTSTSGSSFTWQARITPDGIWTQTFVVTPLIGYAGVLTNVVQVSTEDGITDVYTATSLSLAPHFKVTKEATPNLVQAGEPLTYTIRVTNTGNVDLHATITDTLPAQVTSTDTLIWTPTITAPGGIWVQTVAVTIEAGYGGTLTNVVRVTTEEGPTSLFTETSEALELTVTKRASPDPVQAGEQLTYTIRVTNTSNVTLTATITDILPTSIITGETADGKLVEPGGLLTWASELITPGYVWTKQFTVVVKQGSCSLTNRVQVTTIEGVTDNYTAITGVHCIYLPIILKNNEPG